MGKTKSKLIRKSAENLSNQGIAFTENFGENKKILGETMPSKKMRNQMAGFLSRFKKQEKAEKEKLLGKINE